MGSQGGGGVQQHNTWMARQGSLYSLTLNEVENQLGNLQKPLGSMNLDELLKTVWSAEATQGSIGLSIGKPSSVLPSSSSVQWQPEFVVSRELSNKTVDEVWKTIQQKRRNNDRIRKDHERQPALGEMTLEDFLAKAGIVSGQTRDNPDLFDEFGPQSHWMQYELTPVEQTHACQRQHQQLAQSISGLMATHTHNLQQPFHSGVSPTMDVAPHQETQLAVVMSPTRGTLSDTQTHQKKRVAWGEVVEKTVERRQKRMIKNRESAARSRARKQVQLYSLACICKAITVS